MENRAIKTQYGTIHGRDALILKNVKLDMYPMSIEVNALLDLSFCQPPTESNIEALVCFKFKNIKSLKITMIDESDYQLIKKSCFDLIVSGGNNNYILSTYDHVFDVIGQCEVVYA
ncbi:Uncharacterised protein [Serratia fonticola]|uniref:Uncharacterized protein n=1 Tax=Serratia fonticola TaxID=47917 RepID=A0A0F7HAT8_SERFO|nr:hypothetical protein [Serratia fonticola]AKG69182.1 hypothetical protein WN53_08605 [Serratia fonticola]CAI1786379.1 Uncharacterised protein [Serratia fonticola]VTR45305.1 Uncharacterised protein [Serratia fonticola]